LKQPTNKQKSTDASVQTDYRDLSYTDKFLAEDYQRDDLDDAFLRNQVRAAASRVIQLVHAQYLRSPKFLMLLARELAGIKDNE
jgi:hypothetical protein